MYLSPIQIEKIAKSITKHLKSVKIAVSDEEKAQNTIINIINGNMETERDMEEDALKLFKQYKQAGLDQDKAVQMIKKKLAQERKFVL